MLRAFSMDKTLNKKGRLPFDASKRSMTRSPRSSGCAARYSESVSLDGSTRDGELGCVPIQS